MPQPADDLRSLFGHAPAPLPEDEPLPESPAAPFAGWVKLPGKRWKPVCTANDSDTCWDRLLRWEVPAKTLRVDRLVLAGGRRPWDIYSED